MQSIEQHSPKPVKVGAPARVRTRTSPKGLRRVKMNARCLYGLDRASEGNFGGSSFLPPFLFWLRRWENAWSNARKLLVLLFRNAVRSQKCDRFGIENADDGHVIFRFLSRRFGRNVQQIFLVCQNCFVRVNFVWAGESHFYLGDALRSFLLPESSVIRMPLGASVTNMSAIVQCGVGVKNHPTSRDINDGTSRVAVKSAKPVPIILKRFVTSQILKERPHRSNSLFP